jgi:hypothetical protein
VVRPDVTVPGLDARPPPPAGRVLRAAELAAIGAGRRLYRSQIIGHDATASTIVSSAHLLEQTELHALDQLGERSFGICARAGVLYQQAADLLAELQ